MECSDRAWEEETKDRKLTSTFPEGTKKEGKKQLGGISDGSQTLEGKKSRKYMYL